MITDPEADAAEAERLYGIGFVKMEEIKDMDAVVIAVNHKSFEKYGMDSIDGWFSQGDEKKVLLDLKGMLDKKIFDDRQDYIYWRL